MFKPAPEVRLALALQDGSVQTITSALSEIASLPEQALRESCLSAALGVTSVEEISLARLVLTLSQGFNQECQKYNGARLTHESSEIFPFVRQAVVCLDGITTSIKLLVGLGVNPNGLHSEESPFQVALQHLGISTALSILDMGGVIPPDLANRLFPISENGKVVTANFSELARTIRNKLSYLTDAPIPQGRIHEPYEILLEANALARATKDPYTVYLYLNTYFQLARGSSKHDFNQHSLLGFLPVVMGRLEPEQVTSLVRAIDLNIWASTDKNGQGYHPHEPEIFALMSHPKLDLTRKNPVTDAFSELVTVIGKFSNHHVSSVSGQFLQTIGRIGVMSYWFKALRFDSHRIPLLSAATPLSGPFTSILEEFGFNRAAPRPNDRSPSGKDRYGSGYILSPDTLNFSYRSHHTEPPRTFDQSLVVELRRAYILISHPEHGTLVIRNSSPEFGREQLPYTALWCKAPYNHLFGYFIKKSAWLHDLDPRLIKNGILTSIIDQKAYRAGFEDGQHIPFLVDSLWALRSYLRAWKYDTGASSYEVIHPRQNSEPAQPLERASPGFGKVLNNLWLRLKWGSQAGANRPAAALAFFPTHTPQLVPYEFLGKDNRPQRCLEVSQEVLNLLYGHLRGQLTRSEVARAAKLGLLSFLQTGLDSRGELVIVPARAEEDRIWL